MIQDLSFLNSEKHRFRPRGLRAFLYRCVSCPSAVLAHLCRRRRLHEIPVFKEECGGGDMLQEVCRHYRRFYLGNKAYHVRRNRWGVTSSCICFQFLISNTPRYTQGHSINIEDLSNLRITHFLGHDGKGHGREAAGASGSQGYDEEYDDDEDYDSGADEERRLAEDEARAEKEAAEAEAEVARRAAKSKEAERVVDQLVAERQRLTEECLHQRRQQIRLAGLERQLRDRLAEDKEEGEGAEGDGDQRKIARCRRKLKELVASSIRDLKVR